MNLDLQIFAVKTASLEEMRGERTRLQIERNNQRRYKAYDSVNAFLYARPVVRKKNKNDSDFAVRRLDSFTLQSDRILHILELVDNQQLLRNERILPWSGSKIRDHQPGQHRTSPHRKRH